MDLFRINLDVAAAKGGGIGSRLTSLPAFRKKMQEVRDELAQVCVEAFQSKVPIDTGHLRAAIDYTTSDTAGLGYRATVFVTEGEHINRHGLSYKGGNVGLAELLQVGERKTRKGTTVLLRRTRKSEYSGPYKASGSEYTQGWIDEGRTAFLGLYGVFLRGFKPSVSTPPSPTAIGLTK